jgi:hypothetical protein
VPAAPAVAAPLVAIAVGKTKEGESFPAKPAARGQDYIYKTGRYGPTELRISSATARKRQRIFDSMDCGGMGGHTDLSMTTAGVWGAMLGCGLGLARGFTMEVNST